MDSMIPRVMGRALRVAAERWPVVTLTGPRQSGKTTLVRATFGEHAYVSLEDLDARDFARQDPRSFLARFPDGVILDEVQHVPELLSYVQTMVDADDRPGRFVLTGSSNLLLLESVSQSLAGRSAVLTLYPFSLGELQAVGRAPDGLEATLLAGFYPPVHDRGLEPRQWYSQYVATYVERDVRRILNVSNLDRFHTFVRMCAARSGQLVNLSALGADCGVSHNTARSWLSVLRATHLVFLLEPYHANLNKRLIRTPKLYFTDPGLAAHLLEIDRPSALATHAMRGPLFETLLVGEVLKAFANAGLQARLSFFRDQAGHEVDLLIREGDAPIAVEAKSGATVASDFFAGLRYWSELVGGDPADLWLVYGGEDRQERQAGRVLGWRHLDDLLAHALRRS